MNRITLRGAICINILILFVAITTGIWELWAVFGINLLFIIIPLLTRIIKAKKESNDISKYLQNIVEESSKNDKE